MPGALALLIAGLAIAAPALAQFGAAPKPGVEAEAQAAPTPPQAPKSEPIVEVPLPTEPPPAPVAPRATPPVAVQKPAAPAPRAEEPRPRGECVIKPVMSDEDLRACGARR